MGNTIKNKIQITGLFALVFLGLFFVVPTPASAKVEVDYGGVTYTVYDDGSFAGGGITGSIDWSTGDFSIDGGGGGGGNITDLTGAEVSMEVDGGSVSETVDYHSYDYQYEMFNAGAEYVKAVYTGNDEEQDAAILRANEALQRESGETQQAITVVANTDGSISYGCVNTQNTTITFNTTSGGGNSDINDSDAPGSGTPGDGTQAPTDETDGGTTSGATGNNGTGDNGGNNNNAPAPAGNGAACGASSITGAKYDDNSPGNNGQLYTWGYDDSANLTTTQLYDGNTTSGGVVAADKMVAIKLSAPLTAARNFILYGNWGSRFSVGYSGGASGTCGTGGTLTEAGGYCIHKFTANGTFTPPSSVTSVEALVVGGGGGGGTDNAHFGGGGGAGGYIYDASLSVAGQAYAVTVGSAGAVNEKGGDSIFRTITATGGGKGGGTSNGRGGDGGSGGGGEEGSTGGNSASGQGRDGGSGVGGGNSGGGGGGAGAAGGSGGSSTTGGTGGAGTLNSISGSSVTYAGGGGGSGRTASGSGGAGGGGTGAIYSNNPIDATAGAANTGGGGGGGVAGRSAGAGGSGIVIIRYPKPSGSGTSWATIYYGSGSSPYAFSVPAGALYIAASVEQGGKSVYEIQDTISACSCTPQYFCTGNDLYYRNESCAVSLSEQCQYSCSGSACVPTPSIQFTPFDATSVSGQFPATGHLQVKPLLLQNEERAEVYWNADNASSCSVSGNNGDSWNGNFSGASGKTSGQITTQTVFTLSCAALSGASPPSVTETQTVNLIPIIEEL